MDYRLLLRSQGAHWKQVETVADLACGARRIGAWLKERGAQFIAAVMGKGTNNGG